MKRKPQMYFTILLNGIPRTGRKAIQRIIEVEKGE